MPFGDGAILNRPCVDCGRITGGFCDGKEFPCLAQARVPTEQWANGQATPFCSHCERSREWCHFCRAQPWVRPFAFPKTDPHYVEGK